MKRFKLTDKFLSEITVNKPFKYNRASGEIHSWEEYAEADPNPNNFLVDISKGKIIAAFTGWNVPTWSRQAEKNDNNLFVSSKSGITNPPPYLRTPHIDIDNPNSWEPRSVAMSLIRKYSKLDEIRVNKPRKFHPGEEVIVYGKKYPLSTFSEKYYKEEDGISYYLVDDVKNTGQRFWIEQDKIKKIKPMKENISKQSFAERFLESFNKEIKKAITQIDKASLLNENETAYHGSSNYFRQFQEAGIGGGIGAQIFGWGLYFGKDPEIAKGYTTAGPNVGKTKTLFQGKTAEELGLEYENEVFFGLPRGLKTAQDYVDYA